MGQRHADLLAAILEAEDLFDPRGGHQFRGAVPPRLDDESGVRLAEVGEGAGVVTGERDDLAAALPRCGYEAFVRRGMTARVPTVGQAGEAILEHDDVVVGRRYLTGRARRSWA